MAVSFTFFKKVRFRTNDLLQISLGGFRKLFGNIIKGTDWLQKSASKPEVSSESRGGALCCGLQSIHRTRRQTIFTYILYLYIFVYLKDLTFILFLLRSFCHNLVNIYNYKMKASTFKSICFLMLP